MKKSFFSLSIVLISLLILLLPWGITAQAAQGMVNEGPSIRFTGTTVTTDGSGPVMGILDPVRAYNLIVWSGGGADSIGTCQEENTNTLAGPDGITLEMGDFQLSHFNLVNGGAGDHRIYAGGTGRVKSGGVILFSSENFNIIMDVDYLTNTIVGHGIAVLDPNQPSALRDEFDNGTGEVEFIFNSFSPVVQGIFGIYAYDITIRPAAIQHNINVQPILQNGVIAFPGTNVSLDMQNFQPGGALENLNNILIDRIMVHPDGGPPAGFTSISPYYYWELGSALTSFNTDIVFDISGAPGIQFIDNLRILRRDSLNAPWEEYNNQTRIDATHLRANGVTQPGQWALGITDLVKGDINGDGVVNLADAVLAVQIQINGGGDIAPYLTAEVDGDNKIGLAEAIFILQASAGLKANLINHSPILMEQMYSIGDSSLSGTTVGTVSAEDPDLADILTYTLAGGNINNIFAINNTTGELTLNNSKELYYENAASYTLQVNVSDGTNTGSGNITVNITPDDTAKNVFTYSTEIIEQELVVRINYSQILPLGMGNENQLQPRVLELRPQWNNSFLEYIEATRGQAAVDAEKELALASTYTISGMPEWSEGRFILMNSANTNRVAPGELLVLRFTILKAGFTRLQWNHERTNIAPEETNDILKLMDPELSLPPT